MKATLFYLVLAVIVAIGAAPVEKAEAEVKSETGALVIGKEYFLVDESTSWLSAMLNCENKGAHLAVLTSYEEVEKVAMLIKVEGKEEDDYWIGGFCAGCNTDNLKEEKWQWATGEMIPLAHRYWRTYKGTKTPYDNNGDAKFLALSHTGTQEKYALFTNWKEGASCKSICMKDSP